MLMLGLDQSGTSGADVSSCQRRRPACEPQGGHQVIVEVGHPLQSWLK